MKVTLIGAGGFRTPDMIMSLLARRERLGVDAAVLYDVDELRLARMRRVVDGAVALRGGGLTLRTTTDLDDALEGADVVFCAIRVGGIAGRLIDESVPLAEGVVGQETTGPGGLCFALRTVPAMLEIAERVAARAPNAWFINFTNPAGLVTEALQSVLGDRAIGICDGPPTLLRGVAAALGRPVEDLDFDYSGLNHLGWLRAVRDRGRDRLPELLADDRLLDTIEEGRLFDHEFLRSLGMIPMEYLFYYYSTREAVEGAQRHGSRAAYLMETQRAFYDRPDADPSAAFAAWRETARQRSATYMTEVTGHEPHAVETPEGHEGYGGVALDVVEALHGDAPAVLILNVRNRSSLPFLDENAVVEVPTLVRRSGVRPLAAGDAPLHCRSLVEAVKACERLTIRAAVNGSRRLALEALALHPLVPSVRVAERMLDAYVRQHGGPMARFATAEPGDAGLVRPA